MQDSEELEAIFFKAQETDAPVSHVFPRLLIATAVSSCTPRPSCARSPWMSTR